MNLANLLELVLVFSLISEIVCVNENFMEAGNPVQRAERSSSHKKKKHESSSSESSESSSESESESSSEENKHKKSKLHSTGRKFDAISPQKALIKVLSKKAEQDKRQLVASGLSVPKAKGDSGADDVFLSDMPYGGFAVLENGDLIHRPIIGKENVYIFLPKAGGLKKMTWDEIAKAHPEITEEEEDVDEANGASKGRASEMGGPAKTAKSYIQRAKALLANIPNPVDGKIETDHKFTIEEAMGIDKPAIKGYPTSDKTKDYPQKYLAVLLLKFSVEKQAPSPPQAGQPIPYQKMGPGVLAVFPHNGDAIYRHPGGYKDFVILPSAGGMRQLTAKQVIKKFTGKIPIVVTLEVPGIISKTGTILKNVQDSVAES